jgi:hypothetical protein
VQNWLVSARGFRLLHEHILLAFKGWLEKSKQL